MNVEEESGHVTESVGSGELVWGSENGSVDVFFRSVVSPKYRVGCYFWNG